MTQDERWIFRYQEVMDFIKKSHRDLSKYASEGKLMVHFLKRGRKLMNAGEMKVKRYGKLLEMWGGIGG